MQHRHMSGPRQGSPYCNRRPWPTQSAQGGGKRLQVMDAGGQDVGWDGQATPRGGSVRLRRIIDQGDAWLASVAHNSFQAGYCPARLAFLLLTLSLFGKI